jgi:signal transduction histidine kinase
VAQHHRLAAIFGSGIMIDPDISDPENGVALPPCTGLSQLSHRSVFNTLETMLTFGDAQKQIDQTIEPQDLIGHIVQRINEIIKFDAGAIYFVNQETSDLELISCVPSAFSGELETQFEDLIDRGYVAWAMKERRGIALYSNDARYRVVLHAMATFSRIRGIFIGLHSTAADKLAGAPLQVLTLVLRNAANALENLEYMKMMQRRNDDLNTIVAEKVGELRRRDSHLLNAQKMDAIATLAGGVAHKFNNTLFALTGNLDLLKLDVMNHPEHRKLIERMDTIIKTMADQNQKLLAYARGGKYRPQKVSLKDLVATVLDGLQPAFRDGISLAFSPNSDASSVCVDISQLQLSIAAVVTNAIEALEKGGRIRISTECISVRSDAPWDLVPGDYLLLQISDNGPGMNAATRERVFEPFFSTKFEGRGLSLAAVYGIMKSHDGLVQLDSEPGIGTTVRLYLPIAD